MTREEAIEILKHHKPNDFDNAYEVGEAIVLAIKALEQEQDMTIAYLMGKYEDKEPCEDAISRQAALDCFTATKLKKFDFILYAREEIKKLPSVNPTHKHVEPTQKNDDNTLDALGDAISREAVLKKIAQFSVEEGLGVRVQPLYSDVCNMPSVTPSRRKGNWMLNKEKSHFFDVYECSNCGKISGLTNYCPNCGAEMGERGVADVACT